MKDLLNQIKRLRVLVIGDVMLDRYVIGGVHRISPEAPVPVLTVEEEKIVAGGAANVALNAAALGANVEVCGWFGDDSQGEQLRALLVDKGVQVDESFLFSGAPTISKTRVTSSNHQVCRVDRENDPDSYIPDLAILKEILVSKVTSSDVVIVSDYGKGFVGNELLRLIRENASFVSIDPKPS
ncbi:MAG: D-glycero-beta-D-manno-heptose-7-phosphate kinase, partial [Opitutae bacterium]|nr:D-glycero-beta-D-manno-heptose-7-phosphate kinase [Opitutae bacterium]